MNFRKVRPVEVLNPDGTITIYSSVNKAAKALKKHTMQNYTMVAFGKARIVDIETPIEILNDDGTTTTYSDINKIAEMLKLHTMEIYTMVSNGKAKFMNANINKTNMVSNGEVRMRGRSMPVEVSNDDGTKTTFTSVNRAVKALGKSNAAQIHMIANGKARFVDTSEEEKENFDVVEEEEECYDAVEPPEEEYYDVCRGITKGGQTYQKNFTK